MERSIVDEDIPNSGVGSVSSDTDNRKWPLINSNIIYVTLKHTHLRVC
jgi:hypothetical protein